ncbi:Sporulation kinase D [Gimesia panareensis]|uniref:histidine kinase n=1 Tax=Gimesia panareensis TaxID=2527978 RepID=A0A518FNJ8_9PLAN|nr:HAMP domain-containing sensor histidine kinase [Gimesia panareensis]QDV17919.1 Sporulation kinase D [Gimesia panareensis]
MSSDTGSVETHLPPAIYRRLWSLVPTRSPGSTLCELSSIWCEATGAAAVYLGMFEADTARLTAALFRASEGKATSLHRAAVPVIPRYSVEEQLQSLLEQAHPFSEISDQPAHAFFQVCCEGATLGLFLFSSMDRHANDPLICELLELSQRLLNQALLLQGAGGSDQSAQTAGWIIPDVEKLEAMAEFAAGAGHEINNPVATIVGRVQMLLKSETDPERRQALATIGGQAYRVRDMIGDAMLFARPPAPRPELLSFSTIMQEVLDSLQEEISQAGVQVVVDAADALTVLADEVQWKVVLSNLLLNSLHAMEPGGKLEVRASQSEIESGRILHLQIIDDGAGLSEEERVHLFDPFYSARQAGRGLGFGLSKCWRIATQHGATIAVEPNRQRGVTFHLYWPAESPIVSSD